MPYRHFFTTCGDGSGMMENFPDSESLGQKKHGGWQPPADVFETPDGVVVRFEVAGCCKESLQLRIVGKNIHLRGIRRECCQKQKMTYHQMEIHYGPFERTLSLPCNVEPRKAESAYIDGILEVFLPRAARVTQRILMVEIDRKIKGQL